MKAVAGVLVVAMLTGCASTGRGTGANYNPIVDRPGPNYSVDLSECQAHANRVLSAGESAVNGAIAGAIFGAILSAAVGNKRYQNNYAAVGALSGGLSAAESAEGGQRGIITRCMSGRGYQVLQ